MCSSGLRSSGHFSAHNAMTIGSCKIFLDLSVLYRNSRIGDSRRGKLSLTISCGESQRLRWSFNRAHRAHVRNRLVLLRGTFRASGHLLSETQDFKLPLWSKRLDKGSPWPFCNSQTHRRWGDPYIEFGRHIGCCTNSNWWASGAPLPSFGLGCLDHHWLGEWESLYLLR